MQNRKYPLLPVEIIERAVSGETEAMNLVVQHYKGYIKYMSYYQGRINDETQERLTSKLIEAVLKFRIDR